MKLLALFTLCGVLCIALSNALPKDCQEAYAQNPSTAQDGYYNIDVDGDGPRKPFQVWCQDMTAQGQKLTYIELANTYGKTGNSVNKGVIRSAINPSILTTYYERLLVDFVDADYRLNIFTDSLGGICCLGPRAFESKDSTFSTTIIDPPGPVSFAGGNWNTPTGWGTTRLCSPPLLPPPSNMDLTGTPFTISPDTSFTVYGSSPYGNTFVSADRKTAYTQGAGNCGGGGSLTKYVKLDVYQCDQQWECQTVSDNYNFVACSSSTCQCRANQGFHGDASATNKCNCPSGKSVHYIGGNAYCISPGQCIGLSAGNYQCSTVSQHHAFVECVDDAGNFDKCQCKGGFTGAATVDDKCRCEGTHLGWHHPNLHSVIQTPPLS